MRGWRVVMLAAALTAPGIAHAQSSSGDAASGEAIADRFCAPCHEVGPGPPAPRMLPIAPDFPRIANTPGITQAALNAFLLTSHPKMPNLILGAEQRADVIAYILSLRAGR